MIETDKRNTALDIIDTLRDKYIPGNLINDYYNAIIAYQDYCSDDVLIYLNGLQKLCLASYGISAAIRMLPQGKNITPVNRTTDGTYIDVLDDNEFADAGYTMPVQTVESRYIFYTIKKGDTLESIAQNVYGDYRLYTIIENENNIRHSDFIDNDVVGYVIKLPVLYNILPKDENNLIYYQYNGTTVEEIQKYYLKL